MPLANIGPGPVATCFIRSSRSIGPNLLLRKAWASVDDCRSLKVCSKTASSRLLASLLDKDQATDSSSQPTLSERVQQLAREAQQSTASGEASSQATQVPRSLSVVHNLVVRSELLLLQYLLSSDCMRSTDFKIPSAIICWMRRDLCTRPAPWEMVSHGEGHHEQTPMRSLA